MGAGPGGLHLSTVLRRVRLWSGDPPHEPPPGAYALPDDDALPVLDDLARRATRAGHPTPVGWALAERAARLEPSVRRQVLDPLGRGLPDLVPAAPRPVLLGSTPARQVDATTCGSAVLGLLAAAGDPVLALWLVTGETLPGARLPWGADRAPGPGGGPDAGRHTGGAVGRFAALQLRVKRRTGRRALGPVPWPAALGTPPWTAAREARFADVRFTHRVVDPGDDRGTLPLAAALRSAAAGVPVPLFTGSGLRTGAATAVPRHVVLLTSADPDAADDLLRDGAGHDPTPAPGGWCRVYEPSSGTSVAVPATALRDGAAHPLHGDAARAALGGWSGVRWAVLPRGRRPAARAGAAHAGG